MAQSKKSICKHCDGKGLFPYCVRCYKVPKGVGYIIEDPPGKYDHMPSYDKKRLEAIDRYRERTQEKDMEQLKNNMMKCHQVSTGVAHLDEQLFILYGPRETWRSK